MKSNIWGWWRVVACKLASHKLYVYYFRQWVHGQRLSLGEMKNKRGPWLSCKGGRQQYDIFFVPKKFHKGRASIQKKTAKSRRQERNTNLLSGWVCTSRHADCACSCVSGTAASTDNWHPTSTSWDLHTRPANTSERSNLSAFKYIFLEQSCCVDFFGTTKVSSCCVLSTRNVVTVFATELYSNQELFFATFAIRWKPETVQFICRTCGSSDGPNSPSGPKGGLWSGDGGFDIGRGQRQFACVCLRWFICTKNAGFRSCSQ